MTPNVSGDETTRVDELSHLVRITLAGGTTFLMHINTLVRLLKPGQLSV